MTDRPGRPTLVVVSGPPGAGKTTLARQLGAEIGCPVVCRDEIKQGMVQATPGFVAAPSDPLTRRTLVTFFDVLRLLVGAGVTTVAEAAFGDRVWRPHLEPLTGRAEVRVLRCTVPQDLARRRMTARLRSPVRAAHADAAHLADDPAFLPISLDVPTLEVDTSDGYRPSLAAVLGFVGAPGAQTAGGRPS